MEEKNINESLTLETVGGFATTDQIVALDEPKGEAAQEQLDLELNPIIDHVLKSFERSKTKRRPDEMRWLKAWDNYIGRYGPDQHFSDNEKSRVFIKITKTKILAAFAQITDILFNTGKFPIGIEATNNPTGVLESVHFDPNEQDPSQMGVAPEVNPVDQMLKAGTITRESILKSVGALDKTLERLPETTKLNEGPGLTPTSQTWEPAKLAAKEMENKIIDQLEESNAVKGIHSGVFELCTFGTLIFKGPLAKNKEYPMWNEAGEYEPKFEMVPEVADVSVWDAYPDPDARSMIDADWFIERHRFNKTQLRALKKRPFFREEAIEKTIKDGENYIPEYWEHTLRDPEVISDIRRWEVLEYWGFIDADMAKEANMDLPKEYADMDQIQVNIWVCNNRLLRLVLNPFKPARIPYYVVPYEINPFSVFGVGVGENMDDTQQIMNGFIRLAIDNAVLSSNVILEVNETQLSPGQDLSLYPGKTFKTQGQLGQSIHAIQIPNVTQDCLLLFDKARQLADEATGMPSYSHGVSGVMSVGRTASGMSMLMGAAKENIKSVVRNLDNYLFVPLGQALFAFNMQFNFDKKFLVGDLEVVARGTTSLMRNEVRGQKLLQFYQLTADPASAPFTKRDYLLREIASTLDLDPEKIVNDPREAALQAQVIAELNKIMGVTPQGGAMETPSGLNDPTGNGNGQVQPGASPEPGAPGFTGAGGGNNNPQGIGGAGGQA